MKIFLLFLILLIASAIFLFLPKKVFAQVVINEFSSGSNPEWVELYNKDSVPVPLDGWVLFFQDNPDTTQKVIFTADDMIPEKGFKLVEHGYTGTQAWLRNDGDTIILKDPDIEADVVRYGDVQGAQVSAPDPDRSAGRSPDGTGGWVILDSATPGNPNSPPIPTPTPSPTPTSTPTPEPTNTPTSTSKPPTPTPTKKPTPTLSPTSTPTGEILGEEATSLPTMALSPTSTPTTPISQGNLRNLLPKIFIGAGILLLLGSAVPFVLPKLKKGGILKKDEGID